MARAYFRGHPAYYDFDWEAWFYCDTGELVFSLENRFRDSRPCTFCGQLPTPEGYDPCVGEVPGARSVCCGHGVTPSYVVWENGVLTDGLGVDGRRDVVSPFGDLVRTDARRPRCLS